jgi:hypothetical protein
MLQLVKESRDGLAESEPSSDRGWIPNGDDNKIPCLSGEMKADIAREEIAAAAKGLLENKCYKSLFSDDQQ